MSTDRGREPEAGTAVPAHRRRLALLAVVAAIGLALDIGTKVAATAALEGEPPARILGGLVYFQLVRNPNAAFNLGGGMTPVLTMVAVVIAIGIVWFARRVRSPGWAVGLGLVLAGALGNLVDRIFRAPGPLHGHVIDFISVFAPDGEVWPVFNAADSCICVGAVLIVLLSLLGKDYDGTSARDRKAAAAIKPGAAAEPEAAQREGE